ncbi:MAG: FKBP-type peptidyl-prolyl cis-trans isomerase [Muribaculaceae bacterium]|nr:FKBP-type peptidyl-prolyl cis-trans isomerase [Muribaculaceae bacterium]
MEKEKIQPGKYVELVYDLYEVSAEDGEKLVHQVDPADPEKIIYGVTPGVIQPLERALQGLTVGDEYKVFANAEEAFGPYDPEQVVELEKSIFEIDGKFDENGIKPGEAVPMMTADGYRITGIVLEVSKEKVKMDFNHPLAGKNVRFKGKVQAVREATPEELQPVHGCGCGCHDEGCEHDGCGNGCGGCH